MFYVMTTPSLFSSSKLKAVNRERGYETLNFSTESIEVSAVRGKYNAVTKSACALYSTGKKGLSLSTSRTSL